MPKIKTNRGAAKRFKRTKKGHFKRYKAFDRHLKNSKSPKRLRNLRHAAIVDSTEEKRVRKLLPYG